MGLGSHPSLKWQPPPEFLEYLTTLKEQYESLSRSTLDDMKVFIPFQGQTSSAISLSRSIDQFLETHNEGTLSLQEIALATYSYEKIILPDMNAILFQPIRKMKERLEAYNRIISEAIRIELIFGEELRFSPYLDMELDNSDKAFLNNFKDHINNSFPRTKVGTLLAHVDDFGIEYITRTLKALETLEMKEAQERLRIIEPNLQSFFFMLQSSTRLHRTVRLLKEYVTLLMESNKRTQISNKRQRSSYSGEGVDYYRMISESSCKFFVGVPDISRSLHFFISSK